MPLGEHRVMIVTKFRQRERDLVFEVQPRHSCFTGGHEKCFPNTGNT